MFWTLIEKWANASCGICGKKVSWKEDFCESDGNVCKRCDSKNLDVYASIKKHKQEQKHKRIDTVEKLIDKNKLWDRVDFINEGTIRVDNDFIYYIQKKLVKVKGIKEKYKVSGFRDFLTHFIKKKDYESYYSSEEKLEFISIIEELEMSNRTVILDNSNAIIDGKFIFNFMENKAKVKGRDKQYQMKNFKHFVDVFLKEN